jgi:hypothetical protein
LGGLKAQQERLDYEHMHYWAVAFDRISVLGPATLEAGVRAIADQQWVQLCIPPLLVPLRSLKNAAIPNSKI